MFKSSESYNAQKLNKKLTYYFLFSSDYKTRKGNPTKKDKNSSYENGAVDEPCYYNSSIYYGGRQEVYSPTTPAISPPHNVSN